MSALAAYLRSSLGRKYVMGVTGLGLAIFVLAHMAGNLLLFLGPEAYNAYGHQMTKNKALFMAMESGLLACFLVHIGCGISLTLDNWAARPYPYERTPGGDKSPAPGSQWMIGTGGLVGVFIVTHLLHFRFGKFVAVTHGGVEMRDLHVIAVETFTNPGYLAWYAVALVFLAMHLRHGVWSMFQSMGLITPRHRCTLKLIAALYGAVIGLGFIAPPLYIFLNFKG